MKLSSMITTTRLLSGSSHFLRHLSTAAPPSLSPKPPQEFNNWYLYNKLSRLGLTGEKVTDVLHQLQEQGKQFHNGDLSFCLKKLRQFGRYNHCLQILNWMEKAAPDVSHRALRLHLICKVKGIDKAEKYFDNLPPEAKNSSIYGTLLNCYCTEKMIAEALALFEKMNEMNYADTLTFQNIMGLYMKVDQPEKVPPTIEEMKRRNIPLSINSYQILIQSYGRLNDLEGIERVVNEIEGQSIFKDDWKVYSNLATAYINVGLPQKATSAVKKMEYVLNNSNHVDRIAYHHLISLSAGTGNAESVFRAWDKLISKFNFCHNQSYRVMLDALSKLDDIEGLKKCFKKWYSSYKSYDVMLPNIVIGAYLRHDLVQEAEVHLKDAADKGGRKLHRSHLIFVDYHLGKRQFDSALRHMKAAILGEKWKPHADKLHPFFEYFKDEKDVDGAEEFCCVLEKVQPLDSSIYLWLLQTYKAAGKEAPEMRQRMEKGRVKISTEHEELLHEVCPC